LDDGVRRPLPQEKDIVRRSKSLLLLLLLGGLCLIGQAVPQQNVSAAAAQIKLGEVNARVAAVKRPEQTYALFLPSGYSEKKQYPVIFAFDPLGRGNVPVEALKDLAEKYGYIVAGTYNSRNGPIKPQLDAADAMINDVTSRFAVNEKRMYATGFSGGARVAVTIAMICPNDCIAGVIAHGAGFPQQNPPSKNNHFKYFLSMGEEDFNYPELPELRKQLDDAGVAYHVSIHGGGHEWAPKEVWEDALQWLEVEAMKAGSRAKDDELITGVFAVRAKHAEEREKTNPYQAWLEWKQIESDFAAVADMTTAKQRVAALLASKEVKDGAKRERQEIEKQAQLANDAMNALAYLQQEPSERPSAVPKATTALSSLRAQAKKEPNSLEGRASRRALNQVAVYGYETAEGAMREKDYALAQAIAEVFIGTNPQNPMPHYNRARALAMRGDAKGAIKELGEAVKNGLDKKMLDAGEFDSLKGKAEFEGLRKPL
jgi:predicted esterase